VVAYQQAYQLAPANTLVALTLADALARAGHVPEARRQYESIVKAHPENATALNNLAYLLADTGGDLEEALTLAHRAVKAAPGQDDYADTVGYIYLKKGQRESAVQAFGNLVHKNPHVALFHYHLAMALFEKGDKEGARKELAAALVEHPAPQDEARIRELLNKT
jgi:Flp pilus assembly protein TadD